MTGQPKPWLTIAEAAVLVGRHQSRIYRWIDNPKVTLRTSLSTDGTTLVKTEDVMKVESVTKRGRPRGVPNRRTA